MARQTGISHSFLTLMSTDLDSESVAQYLTDTPNFFEEHAALLSKVQLTSPLTGRAVSLQERQMEVMREKYRLLELRLAELLNTAEENEAIASKFQKWTRALLLARNDVDLPHVLVDGLKTIFSVPQATLRIWGVAESFSHTWFAEAVSDDARLFASGLAAPFCGRNNDFESVSLLDDPESVQSVALLPLRVGASPTAFGLLLLGSPDPARFSEDMRTDFLSQIGETASAALTCLLD